MQPPNLISTAYQELGVQPEQADGLALTALMTLYKNGWHLVSEPVIERVDTPVELPGSEARRIVGQVDDQIIEHRQVAPPDGPAATACEAYLVRQWLQGLLGPLGVVAEKEESDARGE